MGLIDRRWLEDPDHHPVNPAAPTEVLSRFLERSIEQRPSRLRALGLSALQLLPMSGQPAAGTTQELTVAFTDLEGFTRFTDERGDEAALALLEGHLKAVGPIVRGRDGRIVKHLGDGFMLSFPRGDAAVQAAIELVELDTAPLRVRAGLHRGEVAVSRNDLVGNVVNIAARVTEQATGGRVLATVAVRREAGDLPGVTWSRGRRVRLKGLSERVTVYDVGRSPCG
jgi:class 3 adenylate cyclase